MVLPESWTAALLLLIAATICFTLWPNLFKIGGSKWRFELFSLDFAVGALLAAVLAAYTLGTLGSELDFGDSMLVAGRRAQLMAVAAGAAFAFGNMLYFATIALIGLANGTLIAFSVFGCGVSLLELGSGHYLTSGGAFVVFVVAIALAYSSTKIAQEVTAAPARKNSSVRGLQPGDLKSVPTSTKGFLTAVLGGLTFASVWPILNLAQPEELGIGAYGGVLMGAIGILVATFFLDFFFMNISLEGGRVGYSKFFSGSFQSHLIAILCGAVWSGGALALYTAGTGTAKVTRFQIWLVPFAAALASVVAGILFWQKIKLPGQATVRKLISLILFAVASAILLSGFHS